MTTDHECAGCGGSGRYLAKSYAGVAYLTACPICLGSGRISDKPDFHCHRCGAETDIAPDPPALTVCENCCEDHDYRYEREMRATVCFHCGKNQPEDWNDD